MPCNVLLAAHLTRAPTAPSTSWSRQLLVGKMIIAMQRMGEQKPQEAEHPRTRCDAGVMCPARPAWQCAGAFSPLRASRTSCLNVGKAAAAAAAVAAAAVAAEGAGVDSLLFDLASVCALQAVAIQPLHVMALVSSASPSLCLTPLLVLSKPHSSTAFLCQVLQLLNIHHVPVTPLPLSSSLLQPSCVRCTSLPSPYCPSNSQTSSCTTPAQQQCTSRTHSHLRHLLQVPMRSRVPTGQSISVRLHAIGSVQALRVPSSDKADPLHTQVTSRTGAYTGENSDHKTSLQSTSRVSPHSKPSLLQTRRTMRH